MWIFLVCPGADWTPRSNAATHSAATHPAATRNKDFPTMTTLAPPSPALSPASDLTIRRFWIRQILVFAGAVAALAAGLSTMSASAADGSSVVAVVNADPITREMLGDAVVARYGRDVLDNMVNRHLILQQCKAQNAEVTNDEVRGEIERLAKKFGLSLEGYLQLLRDERNITPDQYSREIIWPMLALRRLVADEVEVTQEEFNRAFLSQFGEAVKCRMIMVDDAAQAQQLRTSAAADPDSFTRLAKQYSQDETSASIGGLIPPIRRFMGDSRIEEAAFSLPLNGVSEVLQIGDQYVVLQAVRQLPASHPSPQAMPTIREQIQDRIRDEKMQSAASGLFAQLQADANVIKVLGNPEVMAKYPGVAAVINGQQIPISAVAAEATKRHGEDVLQGEIVRKLLTQALNKAGQTITQADIDAEIDRAAASFGFAKADGQPDVGAWLETILDESDVSLDIYIADAVWPTVALKKLVEDQVTLTQDDLQKGYESSYGPRVEVLAVVLSDQRTAQKVWEMARDNPTDVFFGELAQQYSVEPSSSSNSGKVPPIRKFGGQPSLEREAFAMKPGELSGIIATGDRYIILRCQGFTEPVVNDFNVVREELMRDLTETKLRRAMAAKLDELKVNSEIDNFLEAAKELPRIARQRTGGQSAADPQR